MIQNSKILITGGLGFIGAHLIKALHKSNDIHVLDHNKISRSPFGLMGLVLMKNVAFIEGDLCDQELFKNLEDDFDYIIHAAGILGIQNVMQNPYRTIHGNSLSVINVAEFSKHQKQLKKLLFFSTSEIYGVNATDTDELSDAIIPSNGARWCYATSKFFGEYVFKGINKEYGVPISIVRPFNVYGTYRFGSNAVSNIIARSINNEIINITGDGSQTRCWCYISDFIDGIQKILLHKSTGENIFNIGNDANPISIIDLATQILSLTGSKSKINVSGDYIEDVHYRAPNINRAKKLLGYEPVVDLNTGLNHTINWFKDHVPN